MKSDPKPFLFLSDVDSETTKSRLKVAGVPYLKKRLESGPENWDSITALLEDVPVAGVLVKLSNKSMLRIMSHDYLESGAYLFRAIASKPHIIFVHSTLFGLHLADSSGVDDGDDNDSWFSSDGYFSPLDPEERDWMLEFFEEFDLNVVPYRRNAELSVLAADFIDNNQNNLLFRFYVPRSRIYAPQTADALALFRDYLITTMKLRVKESQRTTATGTLYEFYGDGDLVPEEVAAHLDGFRRVMALSMKDPAEAESLLVSLGASRTEVTQLVESYARRSRRIVSDLRQENELKQLQLRHGLENAIRDELLPNIDVDTLDNVVDTILPRPKSPVETLADPVVPKGLNGITALTVINNHQFIQHAHGVIAQTINGDQHLGPEASQLLELIRSHGQELQLASAVHELEDEGTTPERKLSAGRRLQAFIGRMAEKAAEKATEKAVDVGLPVLVAWIQSKVGPLG